MGFSTVDAPSLKYPDWGQDKNAILGGDSQTSIGWVWAVQSVCATRASFDGFSTNLPKKACTECSTSAPRSQARQGNAQGKGSIALTKRSIPVWETIPTLKDDKEVVGR
jgi:hypothetical protein